MLHDPHWARLVQLIRVHFSYIFYATKGTTNEAREKFTKGRVTILLEKLGRGEGERDYTVKHTTAQRGSSIWRIKRAQFLELRHTRTVRKLDQTLATSRASQCLSFSDGIRACFRSNVRSPALSP